MRMHSAVDPVSPQYVPQLPSAVALAERELGAFLGAVRQRFGVEAARRAASYWMEAFEATDITCENARAGLRKVTIAAASCLATSR